MLMFSKICTWFSLQSTKQCQIVRTVTHSCSSGLLLSSSTQLTRQWGPRMLHAPCHRPSAWMWHPCQVTLSAPGTSFQSLYLIHFGPMNCGPHTGVRDTAKKVFCFPSLHTILTFLVSKYVGLPPPTPHRPGPSNFARCPPMKFSSGTTWS